MAEPIKSHEDLDASARGKMRILVVDDEEPITEIMAATLTAGGYFVETANNGDIAFSIYCKYLLEGLPFDFVLTGLAQPGMNGIDLVGAILKKKPDQNFGFSTAYRVLFKPFEKSQLLAFVRQK